MQFQLSRISLALAAATLLLASTNTFASPSKAINFKDQATPCSQPLTLNGGFYVGGQAGYDTYSVGLRSAITVGGTTANGNSDMSTNGFVGGLFGGYGMYWNNFYYLGGELFANDSGASDSISTSTNVPGIGYASSNAKINAHWSWGISLLPGLKLNDSALAYLRVGFSDVGFASNDTFSSQGATLNGSASPSQFTLLQYGIGLEVAFYQNFSVRGEYNHINYGSFNDSNTTTKFSPSDNQFMAGLVYHFA